MLRSKISQQSHKEREFSTAESIITRMSDANYVSKLEASAGYYWQIKVNEETSTLLTFMTLKG